MTSLAMRARDSGVYLFPHVCRDGGRLRKQRGMRSTPAYDHRFSARHMMVSQVKGQFMVFDGFIEMDPEAKNLSKPSGERPDLVGQHQSS